MEIPIYFLKVKQLHSKKKNKDFFIVSYLIADGLEYKENFISEDLCNKIQDFEPLGDYMAVFDLNGNLKPVLVDIK